VALATRREDEVVALPPDRHRRAADDVVRPAEPGDEQHQSCCPRRRRAQQAVSTRAARDQRSQDGQRNDEDEDRSNECKRCTDSPERGPLDESSLLPGTGEDVCAGEHEEPGQRLAQHQRHIVLRPRVERVDEAGEQPEPFAPPTSHGQDQQPRAQAEQHALTEQHGQMVACEDRALPEQRDVQRVPRWTKDLSLGRLPRAFGNPGACDVVPPLREHEVEAGLQRRRVRAFPDRVRRGEVGPAVGLVVRADERDVDQAVDACDHRDEQREKAGTASQGANAVHSR
jgi:hypothetical protein